MNIPAGHTTIPTFGEAIGQHVRDRGTQVALRYGERSTTYVELDALTNRIANALSARSRLGERIAYLGKNSDLAVAITLGVAKAGMVLVPIIWRLAPQEIAYILADSEAAALFVDEELAPLIPQLGALEMPVIQTEGVLASSGWTSFADWIAAAACTPPAVDFAADQPVLQIYTSGTTGRPKGAVLSHANATRYRQIIEASDLDWLKSDPGETALLAMPYGHIAGAGQALLILLAGGEMIIHREFDPGAVLEAIEGHGLRRLFLVPAALKILLDHPRAETTDFSSLRYFSYGASPIPVPLLEAGLKRLGCQFIQVYGMTETWGSVVALAPQDHDPQRRHLLAAAGKAMPGVDMRVRGQSGAILPPGETGEIEIRSPSNLIGYWHQEQATREALSDDGWLRTGDAGMLDVDGYLYIQDRLKDMIITGAENVYPAEVESVIYGHPDVTDAAVIGVPDPKWGEAVKAVVVLRPGAVPNPEEIIAFARERLAGFKCPKSIDVIDVLPRNPSGKILRRELREPYWAGYERRVN